MVTAFERETEDASAILRGQHDEIEAQNPGSHARWFAFLDRLGEINAAAGRPECEEWKFVSAFGPEGF